MIIAAAQIKVTGDLITNLRTVERYVKKAAAKDVNFVCFPEACISGSETEELPSKGHEDFIVKLAVKFNINIIVGTYAKVGSKIRNQIWVISRKGKTVYKYNKRNLYISESTEVIPGKSNRVLELDGLPFAVINCYDYAFPEQIRELAQKGAKVIFCPSYLLSHPNTKQVLLKVPQMRAFDAMAYYLMVDAIAEDTFKRSRICHPLYEISSVKNRQGLITAEINLEDIDALRAEYKTLI